MEVLCKSEYQDVYRIKDGVLLVVNKFEITKGYVFLSNKKHKKYNKGCQDGLRIMMENCYGEDASVKLPKGTVTYHYQPVHLVSKENWDYQIKTTGDSFAGTLTEINELMNVINNIINEE